MLVIGDREAKVIGSWQARLEIPSRKLSHRHSLGSCCLEKRAVASDHDDIGIVDPIGRREVHRVIPAQSTNLSQFASAASEGVIDFDKVDLLAQGVERGDGVAQLPSGEASKSLGLSERSPCLRVYEPDAHDPVSAVPQRRGASRAGLGDHQWHDR
jgi:DNA-binding transcriptional LysR family regulator